MAPSPAQRIYEMGRKHRENDEQPITALPAHLQEPERVKKIRPSGSMVEAAELQAMLQQIFDANQWLGFTHRNVDLITKVFLFDERLSPQHTMPDLVNAVKIADKEQRLDRVPPPAKPQFPDDDLSQPLSDGETPLPLDAPTFIQRKASIAQMKNLVARLRKFTAWQRGQQQEAQ